MAIKYLGSDKVKVFPSAFRGNSIDPESFLMSESNISGISRKVSSNDKYLYNTSSGGIGICLGGYCFETTIANIVDSLGTLDTSKAIYVGIKVEPLQSSYAGTQIPTLVALNGVAEDNHLLDKNDEFIGLCISQTRSELSGCTYVLRALEYDNGWKTCKGSFAKHLINNVINDIQVQYSENNVDEESSRINLSQYLGVDSTNNKTKITSNYGEFSEIDVDTKLIAKELDVNDKATLKGLVEITKDTVSSSPTSGALKVAGGVGINKKLYVKDDITTQAKIISNDGIVDGTETLVGTATRAINDVDGRPLKETYVNSISATTPNLKISYTKPSGTSVDVELLDLIYPVGSIYMSINDSNPSLLFGGTWEKISGQFLLGAGQNPYNNKNYELGVYGGSTDASIVKHRHTTVTGGGAHTHVGTGTADCYANFYLRGGAGEIGGTNVTVRQDSTQAQGFNISGSRSMYSYRYSQDAPVTVNISSSGTHTHTTTYVGDEATDKNMPPYLVVNIWKRIA